MKRTLAVLAATAVCLTGSFAFTATADAAAAAKPKVYKNCTKLHADYPHGIRKKGAKDKVSGSSDPVPTKLIPVKVKLYKANTKLDRDKDGVACEAK
jgi:hypothetical protein